MDIGAYIEGIAKKAKEASVGLRGVIPEVKNNALEAISNSLRKEKKKIKEANIIDYEKGKKKGLGEAFLDRLLLTDERIENMINSVIEIRALEDPVGKVIAVRRPQGFILEKVRVPIGVVAVIYESRPNVTVDAASLCLKSSNACILRGGSESLESNKMLVQIIQDALDQSGLGKGSVQYVERAAHEGVKHLVKQEGLVDLVIPRGGESLTRIVTEEAMVPVIKHYKGVCHLFVDADADLNMAVRVVQNAKVQRPGTCNALETLLVHSDIKAKLLPMIREALEGVELRGCSETKEILPDIEKASEDDYYKEYLELILAIKVVASVDEAISHIEQYGSSHTDGIISGNIHNIQKFTDTVDSAVVTVNASTRLSDGGVFGLGAEIGISTDKLHARGPMGIGELVTYKWIVRGDGHIR
ncbi:MAG: glutamate-5-semialdehyde dehydrogenase [Spirochaetota bacterium]|nr:MAG: glutamate-5-semialdehyde dehydrogenase [Spirochaetota bacterium]